MKNAMRYSLVTVAGVALLTFGGWGGCGKSEKKEEGAPLVKVDGKVVITQGQFQQMLAEMAQGMDPSMIAKEMQRNVLENQIIPSELLIAKARKENVENDEFYKKALADTMENIKKRILLGAYQKRLLESISEDDAKKFFAEDFEKNKARYTKEQGGVAVMGVAFQTANAAQVFMDKIKTNLGNFASEGRKAVSGKFREFGRVSEGPVDPRMPSMVPAAIRAAALKLSKLPGLDLVKDGKETWVINVSERKEPTYVSYEEAAEAIKQKVMLPELINKMLTSGDLKKEFTVEISEEYFKPEVAEQPADAAKAEQAPAENPAVAVEEAEESAPEAK